MVALTGMAMMTSGSLRAQTLDLDFDMSQLGGTNYDASNVFVTFSGNAFTATLGGTTLSLTANQTPSGNDLTQSISLATIAADGGIQISNANSMTAYISYGSTAGFNNAATPPSTIDDTGLARYSVFEFTFAPTGGGQGDTTYINNFGGGIDLTTYGTDGSLQESRGFAPGVTSGAIFASMASAAVSSSPDYSSLIQTVTPTSGPLSGQTVYNRVVLPNSYYAAGLNNTAAPSYQNYVNTVIMNANGGSVAGGSGNVATLSLLTPTNTGTLSPAFSTVASGADGITAGTKYDVNYNNVTTTITSTGTGASQSYTVTMTGDVTAVLAQPSSGSGTPQTVQYSGLTVTVQIANATALNAFIYGQPTPLNSLTGVTFTQTGTNWAKIANDFTTTVANAVYYQIPGDLAEGFTIGAVGSTQMVTLYGTTTAIGNLTSGEWFENPQLAYKTAQPGSPNYNAMAQYLFENSAGTGAVVDGTFDPSVTFTGGALYANPFDDRYSTVPIQLQGNVAGSTLAETGTLVVGLIPDGDITVGAVPEPGTYALISMGLLGIGLFQLSTRGKKAKKKQS